MLSSFTDHSNKAQTHTSIRFQEKMKSVLFTLESLHENADVKKKKENADVILSVNKEHM